MIFSSGAKGRKIRGVYQKKLPDFVVGGAIIDSPIHDGKKLKVLAVEDHRVIAICSNGCINIRIHANDF